MIGRGIRWTAEQIDASNARTSFAWGNGRLLYLSMDLFGSKGIYF